MTESCSLKKEKKKSVEGFYTNLKFPDSRRAIQSNSTKHIVASRDILNRDNKINSILSNMTNVSNKINMLNTKQRRLRENASNKILSQNDNIEYVKHDNSVIDGRDIPSYLIKQLQTGGVEECKRSCDTNKDCGGFSYWSGDGTCTMKEISILPNPPIEKYTKSFAGDEWKGQFNRATNRFLSNKGKTFPSNRGGVTKVELTPEEKQQLATTFIDTSDFCGGEKIYIDANSETLKQMAGDEDHCAKSCQNDVNCDMYLMYNSNTCNTYKNVSNVSAFCKSGEGHTMYGNLKKNMVDKIIRFPITGGPEGFSLVDDSTEPVIEGLTPSPQHTWTTYVKDPTRKVNHQFDNEYHRSQSDLDASVREYARNVDELKKYNLDLTSMSEGNSEAMDKAIAEYRTNIDIVAENRENKIWIHDKNIVDITKITRKSSAYRYMLWGVLAVIVLILLLRNLM